MSGYIGVSCPVCDKKFVADDDIVVCPICGAPHHRACYMLENECAFEDEHITGKPWKPDPKDAEGDFCINPQDGERWEGTSVEAKTCAYCGARNPKDNLFCCSCGNRLIEAGMGGQNMNRVPSPYGNMMGADPMVAVYGGLSPTDSIDQFTAKEVAAFVGPSSNYYLPRFKMKDQPKRSLDFSLSAFLFGFLYFFYRKMYKVGAVLLVLSIALSVPSFLQTNVMFPLVVKESVSSSQLEAIGINSDELTISDEDVALAQKYDKWSTSAGVVSTILRILSGMFASTFYYKHTLKQMKKIKENDLELSGGGVIHSEDMLRKKGGVNKKLVTVAVVVMIVLTFSASIYSLYGLIG